MKIRAPLSFAWERFTSCSGCQLMLVDCEDVLAALAGVVEIAGFPLVSSVAAHGHVDIALVEGAVSTPDEVSRLLALRRRAGLLVAVGACALTGGVNTLARGDRGAALLAVAGAAGAGWDSFGPQPVRRFVRVDWQVPGCPPERHDLLEGLGALLHGGWPGRQVMPVCMECRCREIRCLLTEEGRPCLGAVTTAGCGARCPAVDVPCEGCRGVVVEANLGEMQRLLLETGLPADEVRSRLERFGGAHDQAGH